MTHRVTFYSVMGGVGRTRALLNVAAILSRSGRRVVAVDLDLESPGFGFPGHMGVSDLILARRERNDISIDDCVCQPPGNEISNLQIIPVGSRADELGAAIPCLYDPLDGDDAYLFEWVTAHIAEELKPDYILFDSSAGMGPSAGICTIELPDVVVAMCGLNRQHLSRMASVISELNQHPARIPSSLAVLALSPVPHPDQVGEVQMGYVCRAIYDANISLGVPVTDRFFAVREHVPDADTNDLIHWIPLDPMVPVTDVMQFVKNSRLSLAYHILARSITRLNPDDKTLDISHYERTVADEKG